MEQSISTSIVSPQKGYGAFVDPGSFIVFYPGINRLMLKPCIMTASRLITIYEQ